MNRGIPKITATELHGTQYEEIVYEANSSMIFPKGLFLEFTLW